MKRPLGTKPWDPVEHLDSEEVIAAYLEAAHETGDSALIAAAKKDVAAAQAIRDGIMIDGHRAVVTFDPEICMYRGEFVGLRGAGGAEFYAKDRERLIEEGRTSLEVYYEAMDSRAVNEFKRKLAAGEEELIPDAYMERFLASESPVRVWRDLRGLSVEDLTERAGIPADLLAGIENGDCTADPFTTASLAKTLRLDIGDLS